MKHVLLSGLAGYHYKAYQGPTGLCVAQAEGSDLSDTSPPSSTPATKLHAIFDLSILVLPRKVWVWYNSI